MSLIASMTIAGTIPLLFHCFLKTVLKERYTAHWRKCTLYLSLFFYLCPFQNLKYSLPFKLPDFMYIRKTGERYYLNKFGYMIVRSSSDSYTIKPVWLVVFGIVWLAVVSIFIIFQLNRYYRLKRELWRTSYLMSREIPYDFCTSGGKWRQRKRRHIYCMKNSLLKTPISIGVYKICIILPEICLDEEMERMIYLHEYTHIRNRDVLKKFLCMGAALLHWFNPAAWMLLYEYGLVSEQICDERVVQSLNTEDEKKRYARLIVELAVKEPKIPIVFADHLSRGEQNMKRRIEQIVGKRPKTAKVVPFAVAGVLLLSSGTAIAYNVQPSTTKERLETAEEGSFFWLEYDTPELPQALDFSESDTIFVDAQTGTFGPVQSQQDIETYADCSHNYVIGKVYEHVTNNNGGCTVNEYSAYKCTKCNKYVIQKLVMGYIYPECPH